MALARFLQISDLHLGRPFAWLPADRREARRRDQQSALEQAIKYAVERNLQAILVPGDFGERGPSRTGALADNAARPSRFPTDASCTACHDPHSDLNRDIASYDAKCLACHAQKKPCPEARENCAGCHMPRTTIPGINAGTTFSSASRITGSSQFLYGAC